MFHRYIILESENEQNHYKVRGSSGGSVGEVGDMDYLDFDDILFYQCLLIISFPIHS